MTEYSKSALTHHANQANHTIDWKKTMVIDREQDRPTRWIKEAVHTARKVIELWIETKAVISWVTPIRPLSWCDSWYWPLRGSTSFKVQWRSQGGGATGGGRPHQRPHPKIFVLYTFYIDDISASYDIVDVKLVWTYQSTVKSIWQICEKAGVLGVGWE